jgi:YD repeat-containing protein
VQIDCQHTQILKKIGRILIHTNIIWRTGGYSYGIICNFQYNGFTTTTTNPLGHQKTTTKNAIGKIIRIDEPKSAWLTHHYNSIGDLIKTVVGGVTTTMKYDIRGNKIKMNDPDMGTWTYDKIK